ncbi:hypothetical protein ACJRO7_000360 [Eucalyptus globulus]|uniref:NAC domain-containing protein n=1 Tax=Eucalyptus globulus TaxID=34317 RepID=A0ABD3LMG7_EUCGL
MVGPFYAFWDSVSVGLHQQFVDFLLRKCAELSRIKSDGDEWFFFSCLQNKYPQSKRARRTNDYGSRKSTGKTLKIRTQDRKNTLGLKKILVFKKLGSPKNAHTKWVLHEYSILNDQSDFILYRLKKNPDENGKKNSKTQKTDTGISIVPQEGSISSPNLSDEVNNRSIPIMPQEGSRSRPNTPDESKNTSCSNTLVIAKSIIPEEIPKIRSSI